MSARRRTTLSYFDPFEFRPWACCLAHGYTNDDRPPGSDAQMTFSSLFRGTMEDEFSSSEAGSQAAFVQSLLKLPVQKPPRLRLQTERRSRGRFPCAPTRAQVQSESGGSRPLALGTGAVILTSALLNRTIFTPLDALPPPQARCDLLTVAAASALILYGLGRAEVAEKEREVVEIGGVDVRQGLDGRGTLSEQADWTARALFKGIPAVRSLALVREGKELFRLGRFRDTEVESFVLAGGIAANVLESGKRAYLADLKVVPTREVEFGFFPEKCQVGVRLCPRNFLESTQLGKPLGLASRLAV
jgi:hypothetical protein